MNIVSPENSEEQNLNFVKFLNSFSEHKSESHDKTVTEFKV